MASNKFFYPPAPPKGSGTFSNDLVGFQLVNGGGLTQGNFEFTSAIFEKANRKFDTGIFSEPYNLENLKIEDLQETRALIQKTFRVYPNFDISQITSFCLYGSLQKRMVASITKIINFFPAAIQVSQNVGSAYTAITANNISYDSVENETTLDIDVQLFLNPFDIDYSVNAARNLEVRPITVSTFRDLTSNFLKFSLCVSNVDNEYRIIDFTPTQTLTGGSINLIVEGNPFSGDSYSVKTLLIKPNSEETEKIFTDAFDEVEDFILNRNVEPIYTSTYQYNDYDSDGNYVLYNKSLNWPLDGLWNLDIRTVQFDNYLTSLQEIAEKLDQSKTNLISRFLTTDALKDFDTPDRKFEKVLQIYGRSFDEIKKFIDALANMNSVNYNTKNDIPSQLLSNLAQTLGMNSNISPITNEQLLSSVFNTSNTKVYEGESKQKTPTELNYQYYKNLILNSAYMFKSKGTRRSIEYIMRLIGAPKSLVEFNEVVYVADAAINIEEFQNQYATISGGTVFVERPILNPSNTFSIMGVTYTGFSSEGVVEEVTTTENDYPIDKEGFPKTPNQTDDYFFQKGSGWFEQTPKHRSIEEIDLVNSNFTQTSANIVSNLKPYTFGQDFLERYRNFPHLNNISYVIKPVIDNQKSWPVGSQIRVNDTGSNSTNYKVTNDKLVVNAKNIEMYMNMGQGITYDIWDMSVKYNYPIPNSGLTAPYPTPGNIDWTVINPKPREKTFFEFAQTFYNNLINVRNRQTIFDGKTGGYPSLQSIYWRYLKSDETVNIPSNKFTYQKMIDFTLGIGDYWVRLLEQLVPASTLWLTGQKMENSIFHRQKFVWRRQRGCKFIPVSCVPCRFDGQPFGYDCIDQTITCGLPFTFLGSNGATILSQTLNNLITTQGYNQSQCDLNGMTSEWFIDLRIDNVILLQEQFYNGYGFVDYPTDNQILTAIDDKLSVLYQYGLNYYIAGDKLIVSNSTCYDDFTNKRLTLNVGVKVNITCSNN